MAGPISVRRPHMPGYGLLPADQGRGLLPFEWAVERFARSRNYWVATGRPDGRPHLMPVWGVFVGNVFTFSTGQQTRKARNLLHRPECVVSVEHADEPVVLEGVAELWDPSPPADVSDAYKKKYQWAMDAQPGLIFRVDPHVVLGFIEAPDEFPSSATRWEFGRNSD